MQKLVHRLSDPRDPSYPFSDTYICSKCNERLQLTDTHCTICNLGVHGMVKITKPIKISNDSPDTIKNEDVSSKEIDITNINNFNNDKNESVKLPSNEITIDKIEIPINGTFKEIFYLMLLLFLILFIIMGYDINNTIVKALIE